MRVSLLLVAACSLVAVTAQARPSYRSDIPNGTVNSCLTCHNSSNGGSRNVFGRAFASSSTFADICDADSDGDGQTNGEELGDPDCIWTSGAAARSTNISNPGVANSTSSDPTGGSANTGGGNTGAGEGEGDVSSGGDVVAGTSDAAWMCDPTWFGDDECDCGCGTLDVDCADNAVDLCLYNECDTWQSDQGLLLVDTDPTQCEGGTSAGTLTCPDHATADGSVCTCDAGFSADAAATACVVDTNTGGNTGGGGATEGEGDTGGNTGGNVGTEGEGDTGGNTGGDTGGDTGTEGEGDGLVLAGAGDIGDDAPEPRGNFGCAATLDAGLPLAGLALLIVRRRRR